MRRLLPRLFFHASSMLSLLAFLTVLIAWPRSYWKGDQAGFIRTRHLADECVSVTWCFDTGRGAVRGYWSRVSYDGTAEGRTWWRANPPGVVRFHHRYDNPKRPTEPPPGGVRFLGQAGFGYKRDGWKNFQTTTVRMVIVPMYALAIATAILPLFWFRGLKKRRPRPGHCPACGYDLRATPDRCPECGRVPTAGKA
jgi:hypothetical protein